MLCWVYIVDGVLVGRCAASAATTWAPSMKEVKRKGGCVWWITIIGNSAQLCWRHSQVGFCCWGRLPLRREWWQTAEPYWGPWLNNRRVSVGGGVKVWVRIPLGLKNTQTRINFTRFPCCDGIWTRDSLTEGRGANHITTLTCCIKPILRQLKIFSCTWQFSWQIGRKNFPCYIGSKKLSSEAIFAKFSA